MRVSAARAQTDAHARPDVTGCPGTGLVPSTLAGFFGLAVVMSVRCERPTRALGVARSAPDRPRPQAAVRVRGRAPRRACQAPDSGQRRRGGARALFHGVFAPRRGGLFIGARSPAGALMRVATPCPCALVLSTPRAVLTSLLALCRQGAARLTMAMVSFLLGAQLRASPRLCDALGSRRATVTQATLCTSSSRCAGMWVS